MRRLTSLLVLVFLLSLVGSSFAVETKIMIRARAKDAKFIGTSMGGALVTIRDALTGELLSKGLIQGTTGNTKLLMTTPIVRGMKLTDDRTAGFEAVLDLSEPRKIEIEVLAPYGQPQAMARATVTTWVVPGKHITGDGLILEIPGFVVRVTNPTAHTFLKAPASFSLVATVTPMCGCPVSPNTFWKPEAYEVKAIVKKNGQPFKTIPLKFSGKTNYYVASISLNEPGAYQFTIYAFDPATGNTGVDMTTVVVR
ncbi:hypothetical protein G4V39_04000 [Thermosulfuriphilus ammonigenes]|uniref:Uncharacterized protein n=1 Tax=Thermosulfuriphilus ammonigenes TaxID=1936021 RepID=A0A6G7PV45_9BACT|nr:hypothetical protein [Thermosulfuriphilus ammonigenes]MBA2848353.1 hypothetical protein [Thermosulfuriphilus ammonigenes]QIJ71490.1 hypothetical protein G4V39_04000 [Thermosulfuriphilus ammonigenes]